MTDLVNHVENYKKLFEIAKEAPEPVAEKIRAAAWAYRDHLEANEEGFLEGDGQQG
jgi:hypothetical protein